MENKMMSYSQQSERNQKEIQQLKDENDLLRKQIQDITEEDDSTLKVIPTAS